MATYSLRDEIRLLSRGDRLIHLIYTQQLTRSRLDDLFAVAEKARQLYTSRVGAVLLKDCLPNRRALLYFVQPSTRTFLSFQSAAEILGMSTAHVTSTATSSETKGETPLDSVHTFAMYHDLIAMRYPEPGFASKCATYFREMDVPKHIINAGSGMDQHPTQAILDVYTLHREFSRRGGIDGKRVLFVGDLARGRAVRSLIYLLGKYEDIAVDLVAPSGLGINDDMKTYMEENEVSFREGSDLKQVIGDADAIYMTRVQDEYESISPAGEFDYDHFSLTAEMMALVGPNCAILHPLPRRSEIPVEVDADPRSRYWDEVENGMWARVALIAHILECDLRIRSA
jgi:aspartate carbamoyltransferase catalytic subunit